MLFAKSDAVSRRNVRRLIDVPCVLKFCARVMSLPTSSAQTQKTMQYGCIGQVLEVYLLTYMTLHNAESDLRT